MYSINTVKFNLDFLRTYLKEFEQVYIICRSGNRSSQIFQRHSQCTTLQI
jgi:hypothetical protein